MRKIAIPLVNGKLADSFKHSDTVLIVEVDDHGNIHSQLYSKPPSFDPGIIPDWLLARGVMYIILNLSETTALRVFEEKDIVVLEGYPDKSAEELVQMYAKGFRPIRHKKSRR